MKATFKNRVYEVVKKIPRGKTASYKEVASRAGSPNAYRAVGNILNTNHNPNIPCHRVIRSDGSAGGYNRGKEAKQNILKEEGAIAVLCIIFFVLTPLSADAQTFNAAYVRPPDVRIWNHDIQQIGSFPGLAPGVKGGGYVATGDVNGDGKDEIIVGAGLGSEPIVQIFSGNGTRLGSFFAYLRHFKGGVRVAVGDVNGDGKDEIITSPGPGTEPKIHIFDEKGKHLLVGGALAYAAHFQGGIHIATTDLTGDGKAEIITSPGPSGGPHIRIFDGQMHNLGMDFFAYDPGMRDGVTLTAIRSPEGSSIVTAIESWDMPIVSTWVLTPNKTGFRVATEFLAFDVTTRNGLRVGAFDIDNDGNDEIVAARNGGTWGEVRVFDRWGTRMGAYLLQDPDYRGAMSFAQADTTADGQSELLIIPTSATVNGPTTNEKSIRVDISEQRLYAYERGRIARDFLISSGLHKFPTPENWSTSVKAKIPVKDYKWTYGVNHPDNYHLKNVKYNLNIGGPFYIHYAYWHNNFGRRMSHGCVNASLADAEWIYNWADVGTPVETVP